MTEIELKLAVSEQDLNKLRKSPTLARISEQRAVTRQVHSVYYDTPKFQLREHAIALRLRKTGSKWIQTVKLAGSSVGGLEMRPEYEASTAAQLINWPALEQTPVAETVAKAHSRHTLHAVFVTDFRRTSKMLKLDEETRAEISFDSGEIRAGTSAAPLTEVELELKSGNPASLIECAKHLLKSAPSAHIEIRSKAERGYALAAGVAESPQKAHAIPVEPGMTAAAAFSLITSACLRHFQANRDGVAQRDDIEYVHQARVALRRLRSCFSVFRELIPKDESVAALAGWRPLALALGEVRDLDVLATATLPTIQSELGPQQNLDALLAHCQRDQAAARTALKALLQGPRQTEIELDLGLAILIQPWQHRWSVDTQSLATLPVTVFAQRVLDRAYKRLRRDARAIEFSNAATIHALRIRIKKLRYAAEFFSPLFEPKQSRDFLEHVADLQEILGQFNDGEVLLNYLQTIESSESSVSLEPVVFLKGFILGRRAMQVSQMTKFLKQLRGFDAYWRR